MRRKNKIREEFGKYNGFSTPKPTQPTIQSAQPQIKQQGQTVTQPVQNKQPQQNPQPNQPTVDIDKLKADLKSKMPNASPEEIEQILINQLSQQNGKMEAIFNTLKDLDVLIEKKFVENIKRKFRRK
jgi:hypothetical protein